MTDVKQVMFVCIRPHYWGASDTKKEAIDNCLRQGSVETGMEDGEVKANIYQIRGGDDFVIDPVNGSIETPHDLEVVEKGLPIVTTKTQDQLELGDYVSMDIISGKLLDTVDLNDREVYVVYQNRHGEIQSWTLSTTDPIPILEDMVIEDEKEPCYRI